PGSLLNRIQDIVDCVRCEYFEIAALICARATSFQPFTDVEKRGGYRLGADTGALETGLPGRLCWGRHRCHEAAQPDEGTVHLKWGTDLKTLFIEQRCRDFPALPDGPNHVFERYAHIIQENF